MLNKNSYLEYLRCPQEFWLNFHSPAPSDDEIPLDQKHRREQGFQVLQLAKKMSIFNGEQAGLVEFHRIFSTDYLITSTDITVTDRATGTISIYEVTSSSKVKDKHLDDVAFQKLVLEMLGHTVAKTFLITVDTAYLRNGHIDPDELLKLHDITAEVDAKHDETLANTQAALRHLKTQPEPEIKLHCEEKLDCGFIRYHFKDIPVYNVSHISRLKTERCSELISRNILDIRHVPADFKLTEKQRKQVETASRTEPVIDREAIRTELEKLEYPLNFLDYETFSYAVPQFAGTRPYQQVVFQYSLHTIPEPDAQPVHCFHLSKNDGPHPPEEIAESLHSRMAAQIGTVIVWNAGFEKTRNREMAEICPDFAEFFHQINASLYDLETIFAKDLYLHPGFLGKTSIKNVQPILYPEASYKDLEIGDGTTAAIRWYHMATQRVDQSESEKIYNDLCSYCHLDTLAMVEIYNILRRL